MKTVEHSQSGSHVKAILHVKDWFSSDSGFKLSMYDNFYVVATWHEYTDGQTISYEAKTTVAICAKLVTAKLVYAALS